MAWTPYQIFLAFLMASTGSLNTLTAKWADETEAEGRDGYVRPFKHPFFQACTMFLGEMLCLLVFFCTHYWTRYKNGFTLLNNEGEESAIAVPRRRFNPFVLLPPALLDLTGTSIMFIGLNMTYASSYQMLRGAVIIFTGLLSVTFLNRKLAAMHWYGILLVIVGLGIVGAADMLNLSSDQDTNGIITGDLLIVMAQIATATQMVVEEKFVGKHNIPPLLAVGLEGCFGFTILSLLLIPFYYIPIGSFSDNPGHRLEDVLDAFYQMGHSWVIIVATVGNLVSIAFFNFAGISVTKEISATTRMVLDSIRTLVVWAVSLGLGWQDFHWLQIFGFISLVAGMCVYNNLIILPLLRKWGWVSSPALNSSVNPSERSVVTQNEDNVNTEIRIYPADA